jgi:hypothetical protein
MTIFREGYDTLGGFCFDEEHGWWVISCPSLETNDFCWTVTTTYL